MNGSPNRDPAYYRYDWHSQQRQINRGIPQSAVDETIAEGIVQEAKGSYPNVKFVHVPECEDEAVAVVANGETGDIHTVYWAVHNDHPKIVELRRERGCDNSLGVTG